MNTKGLTATIQFADHAFAQEGYNLALGGVFLSVSIGFIAKDYEANGEAAMTTRAAS